MAKTDELVFDWSKIDIFDYQDCIEAERRRDFRGMSVVMAKACVKCPEDWGAPDNPDSFRRPLRGKWAWKDVVQVFIGGANDSGE